MCARFLTPSEVRVIAPHIANFVRLVADAFEIRAETRTLWARSLERVLGRDVPNARVAARVFNPEGAARLRGWLADDLAIALGLHEPLGEVVAVSSADGVAREVSSLAIAGGPPDALFRRYAAPIPGLDETLTLVVQIEGDESQSHAAETDDLSLAMPAFARAYTHTVGLLSEHRERLLALLHERYHASVLLLVEGLSERQIAERTGRPQNTVHDHVKRVYAAWDVNSRVALRDLWCTRP